MTKILFDKAWTKEEKQEFVKPLLRRLYKEQGFLSAKSINECEYLPWYSTLIKVFSEDSKNVSPLYEFIGEEIPDHQKRYVDRYTLEDARKIFNDHGCLLLSEDYVNTESTLDYICNCGKHSSTNLYNFLCSPKCKSCKHSDRIKKRRENRILNVINLCSQHNCTFVDLKESDKGFPSSLIYFVCSCGNEDIKKWGTFQVTPRCKNCHTYHAGENHYAWKGGIADERDTVKRSEEYRNWRIGVFERDSYTCQACGDKTGGNLRAHHILNYSKHEEKRFDIDNGITLCDPCHNPSVYGSFHHVYGTKTNTREQLEEYIKQRKEMILNVS